jgi:hypothetical protein
VAEVPVLVETSELQFVTRDNDNTDGLDNGDDIGFYLNGIHFHLASFVNSYLNSTIVLSSIRSFSSVSVYSRHIVSIER